MGVITEVFVFILIISVGYTARHVNYLNRDLLTHVLFTLPASQALDCSYGLAVERFTHKGFQFVLAALRYLIEKLHPRLRRWLSQESTLAVQAGGSEFVPQYTHREGWAQQCEPTIPVLGWRGTAGSLAAPAHQPV